MRTCHFLLVLFALTVTGCVSEDLPPQPGYVSTGQNSMASVAPSVTGTGRGAIAANSSRHKDRRYFVEFRSRYALSYGHTYVVFGRLNEAGRAANPEVAGLHPASTSQIPYQLADLYSSSRSPSLAPVSAGTGTK